MLLHEDTALSNCKDLQESTRTSETERNITIWWRQCAGCDTVVNAPNRVRGSVHQILSVHGYHMICGFMIWDGMITKL